MPFAGFISLLLSDTHQGKHPGHAKEQGRCPGGKKRGEDPDFPKEIKI